MPDGMRSKSRRLMLVLALALNLAAWILILHTVVLRLVNN